MRRLLVLTVLVLMVAPVSATLYNWQPTNQYSNMKIICTTSHVCTAAWVGSTTGGNSYVQVNAKGSTSGYDYNGLVLKNPYAVTYAAATTIGQNGGTGGYAVQLFNSGGSEIYKYTNNDKDAGRYELKMSGTTAYIYVNGVLHAQSSAGLVNPSYVSFGRSESASGTYYAYWDDYVYGESENKYVLNLPLSDNEEYIILDDIVNDASDGLYNTTSDTQISSTYMSGWWSRGDAAVPPNALANESIQLINYNTGTVYATNYTGTAYYGTVTIDIETLLIDAHAPDGYYALTIPGTGAYSNFILKRSNGASVTWDRDNYNVDDTGVVITVVADGGYWDVATYDYKLGVMDIYGQFHGSNTTVTTQTQTITHEWDSDTDNPGVYYAILFATDKATGTQYIFGSDYAELSAYVAFAGYVNDAQTGSTISGANVTLTQGITASIDLSGFDGNYSTVGTDFDTGSAISVNATASSYRQYTYTFTPLASKTIALNISLVPSFPNTSGGYAIGGVARDIVYGRPIEGVGVVVQNTTAPAEGYTQTTSMTGWYRCGSTESCLLTPYRPYQVWGNKTGYHNSSVYTAVSP